MSNKKTGIVHQVERHIIKPIYFKICRAVIKKNPCEDWKLVESEYNCGYVSDRMTERGLELSMAKDAVDSWKMQMPNVPIVEVGAVTPYYFPGMIKDVLDAYDKHELVNLKMDLLDYNFIGANVLSISTIEHVGTGDYQLEKKKDAVFALKKILDECEHCFITWGMGYNKVLDLYVIENLQDTYLEVYSRGKFDNKWKKEADMLKAKQCKYTDIGWADMLAVIRK